MLKKILLILLSYHQLATADLQALDENELSEISGQASLVSFDKYNHGANNFYQLKVNSEVEVSVNIDQFFLSDSAGNPQIDIDNFSINGGTAGVSSATMTNPFVEFAFAGDIDASNARSREIIGIRLGADEVNGVMSFGNRLAVSAANNHSSINGGGAIAANSGINWFRGYMKTAPLSGSFQTYDSTIPDDGSTPAAGTGLSSSIPNTGNDANGRIGSPTPFTITGKACDDFFGGCGFIRADFTISSARMFFGSVSVPTTIIKSSGITVNTSDGNPISSFTIVTDDVPVPDIDARIKGTSDPIPSLFNIEVSMNAYATLTNVEVSATIPQELSFIHRANITSSGGPGSAGGFTLSAQNQDIQWRGDPAIAKTGWWMSINDDVDMGDIASKIVIPDSSLVQISQQASNYLGNTANPNVPVRINAFGAIFGVITPNVGDVPLSNVVPVVLNNSVDLGSNQNEIRNCWNGSLGC